MKLKRNLRAVLAVVLGLFLLVGVFISAKAQDAKPGPVREEVIILPGRVIAPPEVADPLTMEQYAIKTSIDNNMAKTIITQKFKNHSGRTLQATYMYPLPEDAHFSSFTLMINGKAVEGKIMEKAEAQRTYYSIVQKHIDPGLLEFVDRKTVKVSVAPIFAGETKEITLSYTQLLSQDGGLYKYQYPFGFKTGEAMPIRNTSLDLSLETDQPIKTVYSPTHKPVVERSGERKANVSMKLDMLGQEKNFILYFSKDSRDIALNTLSFKEGGDKEGYFLLTLLAPKQLQNQKVLPKDVVLVLDTSGSMSGEKIVQAKEALKYITRHLRPEDTFNIVQFNTDVSTFRPESMAPTAANVQAALDYVEKLDANGSTNIEEALKVGFGKLPKANGNRPPYVIFLTDGEPTVGVTDTAGLLDVAKKANTKDGRLFVFGLGYDVNTELLGKLSDQQHGSVTYVEPDENLELALTGFYNKIESPVLTDVALDFGSLHVVKTYPKEIGDLFAGSEIILLGRYGHGGQDTITLTGKVGSETRRFTYPVRWESAEGTTHSQLPRLWAGRRIGFLLDSIQLNGEKEELKDEVVALSKQFGIITPYTSYLALDPDMKHEGRYDTGVYPSQEAAAPAAAPPMGSMAALRSKVGQGAVQMQKSLNVMKQQASVADMEEAQTAGGAGSHLGLAMKTIGTKTFVKSKEGVWTDTAYDEKQHGKPSQITFGSPGYFDLLQGKPELTKYFTLGDALIVVIEGKAYEVVPAKAT